MHYIHNRHLLKACPGKSETLKSTKLLGCQEPFLRRLASVFRPVCDASCTSPSFCVEEGLFLPDSLFPSQPKCFTLSSIINSSELHCGKATTVLNVFKFQLLKLFAFCVEIDAAHSSLNLIEAYVVEPFETRAAYCSNAVIGD